MDAMVGRSIANPRFNTAMLGIGSMVAVILAAVGLFGVISYSVTERKHEIGIRMALGAERTGIIRSIVGRGAVLAGVGVAGGLALSVMGGRLLEGFVFGISVHDATTYSIVSAVFLSVTLLASFLPARRASRVDPMTALRRG